MWVNQLLGKKAELKDGVEVIDRTDYNYSEVADNIKDAIAEYAQYTPALIKSVRTKAAKIADQAQWKNFIQYYFDAYDFALRSAEKRNSR